ncbi:MAG: flagellar hook-associated protein FlgL [Aquabacterium sp.]
MRIASTQYHSTMTNALQSTQGQLEAVIQQMASGRKLMLPSEDPVTSVRLSRLNREEAALTQYRDNIEALASRLRQNESLLEGMNADLMQARDLLVWAADGGNTTEDVQAMASSLVALRDSLFYSANSRDQEGRHLFSGTATGSPAVTFNSAAPLGTRYTFSGNTVEQKVVVGHGVTQTANVTLQEMPALLNALDDTIAALQTPGVNVNDPATRTRVKAGLLGVDQAISSVSAKVAVLGGAQNTLATLAANHANVSLSNQQSLIKLGQLDYGEASVRLNGYSTALQATQKAYGKVSDLSLFDVI